MATVPLKLLFVFGTRPETIKLFPLIRAAQQRPGQFTARVCVTGQHRQMLDTFLDLFALRPDHDLDVMLPGQALSTVAARVLERLDPVLERERPDAVLVQGDTTTAMAGALAAFHRRIPVGHVEAGLRTWDLAAPFPEELNRQVVGRVAAWHFAPTPWARDNLLKEGVAQERIHVTGNTGIDTVAYVRQYLLPNVDLRVRLPFLRDGERLVLVTGHRRESFGTGFEQLCLAIRDVVERHADVRVVYPVHLNPNVQAPVRAILGPAEATGRLHLLPPADYLVFAALLDRCHLVITDSGGVQEEAPSYGKPALCTRSVTERPEGVDAGAVKLVGTDRATIAAAVDELLNDPAAYQRMATVRNPYGDGQASGRILDALAATSSASIFASTRSLS
jgi:UDP-N-acetylglucosamine 2-epimerase (non-hydrolysing)